MSKQVSNQLRKLLVQLKITPRNYTGILTGGTRISAYVAGLPIVYATPQPALIDVDNALGLLKTALQGKGGRYNRASKISIDNVQDRAIVARGLVIQLLQYVQATIGNLSVNIPHGNSLLIQAGSAAQNVYATTAKQSRPVRNLKWANTRTIPASMRTITWKKPQGVRGNKKPDSYVIVQEKVGGGNPNYVLTTTKCSHAFSTGWPVPGSSSFDLVITPLTVNGFGIPARITINPIG